MVQKWPFFQVFFLGNICQENVICDILERQIAFLGYKNKNFKSQKINIFPEGFCPKVGIFRPFFFSRQYYRPENVFYDILGRKKAFLSYKNKKFKKSKNWHISKGVNQWFWPNNGHFFNFLFLGNIAQQNYFYDILERKNAFLGYKNKTLKKSKYWHFSKEVNPWFGPKMAIFSGFFFRQYRSGKCNIRYSRTTKRLSRL